MKIDDFDAVALLACEMNIRRLDPMLDELGRVGILTCRGFGVSSEGPDVQTNTARLFSRLLAKGAKHALLLEDDVRFLKDAARARAIIESGPACSCDGVFFDIFPHWDDESLAFVKRRRAEGVAFYGMLPMTYGTSCYAVNRRYMERFLELYGANPGEPPDSRMYTCARGLDNCFSMNPPCVQLLYSNANNLRWGMAQHRLYKRWGVDYADFNVPEGYTWDSVIRNGEVA